MKISRKSRSYKNIPKRYYFPLLGPAYDKGPVVESIQELPPVGHPAFVYIVRSTDQWFVWDKRKGKWKDVTKTGICMRVRPVFGIEKEVGIQPLAEPQSLVISARFRI